MKGSALRRLVFLGPFVAVAALVAALPAACSSSDELVTAGGECFLASDCAPGLICLPQKSGARVCSADLSSVVGKPPAEGGVADADVDGETPEAGADAGTEPDTGAPDTGTPDTGVDTGTPDTGAPDAADG